jgi:hypothetical protein
MGMKKEISQDRRTAIKMVCEWRTADLLDRLQNGTHRGNGGEADQSTHGRTGKGTACKQEVSRMRNILIESSGVKKKSLQVEENCIHRRISICEFIIIIIIIIIITITCRVVYATQMTGFSSDDWIY